MSTDYIILNQNNDNTTLEEGENVNDPVLLSKNLHKLMKRLKGEYFQDDKSIDYANLYKSDLFNHEYAQLTNQLKQLDLNLLLNSGNETNDKNLLAFFINIYNSLTIHSLAFLSNKNESGGNLLQQLEGKFWSRMAYIIGNENQAFSLDDIEHGILRANRLHPSKKYLFNNDDQRMKYSLKKFDPRIHFALNCGAKGCPPISFYTVENVERGLQMATTNFVTSETNIDSANRTIELSKLFLWYKLDFTNDSEDDSILLKYVLDHLKTEDEKHSLLQNMVKDSEKITIKHAAYDWNINRS